WSRDASSSHARRVVPTQSRARCCLASLDQEQCGPDRWVGDRPNAVPGIPQNPNCAIALQPLGAKFGGSLVGISFARHSQNTLPRGVTPQRAGNRRGRRNDDFDRSATLLRSEVNFWSRWPHEKEGTFSQSRGNGEPFAIAVNRVRS